MRVVVVVHGFPPAASGGTEIYVADFARALARLPGLEVSVLTRDADPNRPEYSVRTADTAEGVRVFRINNTFQACTSFEESYTNPALGAVARELLDEIDPDVVHVQHLTCLSTGIIEHVKSGPRARPVVMTLNDYWLMCHRGQLLRPDGARCEGPFEAGCDACVPAAMLAGPAAYRLGRLARALPLPGLGRVVRTAQETRAAFASAAAPRAASHGRLEHLRAVARAIDMFLAPSATMEGWALRFGIERPKLERCDQGIDLSTFVPLPRSPGDTLRLAFAGSLIPSKAPHVLLEAVASLPAGRVTVDLLGMSAPYHGDASYQHHLAQWLGEPFVRKRGPVPHDRVADAFREVDVLVVPSVWLENAPFVIREAFAAGLPVIASNLGGMAEMIEHERNGLLFAPGDPADLARQLRRLLDEPALLESLRRGVRRPMSVEQDAAETLVRYERLASRRPAALPRPASGRRPVSSQLSAVILNYRTPDQTWLAARSIASSTAPASIVVVDNGSVEDSAQRLARRIPQAHVIATGANLGFSGGCNVGIRHALGAGAQLVLLVNSDAVLEPRAIERLIAAADAYEHAGIFAPVLLSREEPDRIASAGIRYSSRTGRMRQIAAGRPISMLPAGPVRRVDAVSGCVMLVRRGVFASAGLLDESFFFSFEDIEFCLRARRAGFDTLCVQDAIAYHEGGRSIGRTSPDRLYYAARNHLRLAEMADEGLPGKWLRRGGVVALNAGYALLSGETSRLRGLAAVARGTWHHLGGRYGRA